MKKVFAATIIMFCFLGVVAGASYAWQGRMEGMDNPQGLIGDESDLLIHPTQIASGEGVKYYFDYKFTYTGLIHMDSNIDLGIGPINVPILGGNLTSGHATEHNTLIGATFPFAKGRMGVFFGYDKQNGDFDSDIKLFGYTTPVDSNADTRLDNYALRLIYGQPVGGMNLGAELGVAYRNEKQDDTLSLMEYPAILSLEGIGATLPYMIPFNSNYWELSGKLGLNKKLNKTDIEWTVYGAGILSAGSDNQYLLKAGEDVPIMTSGLGYRDAMNGDVSGYRVGSDLWVRHQLNEELSLPFLVSVGYTKKDRDGDGLLLPYAYGFAPLPDPLNVNLNYKDIAKTLNVKVGGGVVHGVKDCGQFGVGLYYNYIQSRDRLDVLGEYVGLNRLYLDNYAHGNLNKFPYQQEHRLVLNVAGEQVVCDDLTVRGGLDFFYGWVVSDDYGGSADFDLSGFNQSIVGSGNASLPRDGHTWGISGSLGATKKLCGLTFEPFIKGGYQFFDTAGSTQVFGPVSVGLDKKKAEWFTACGLSVLFGK
jgi:hypothetical protein